MSYPKGIASTDVYDVFNTNFSPNDVVKQIVDNYSAVNRTTMMNSVGYQISLVQNFVNSSYLGRSTIPVQNAYMVSGWASGLFAAVSGTFGSNNYTYSALYPQYVRSLRFSLTDVSNFDMSPDEVRFVKQSAVGIHQGSFSYSGLYLENSLCGSKTYIMNGTGTPGNVQATWNVTGTDYLYIGNDSVAPFSGKLTLKSNLLDLWGLCGIYLKGDNAFVDTNIYFWGTNLLISGGTNSSNIKVYNNIYPTTDSERELGDDSFRWRDAYITKTHSRYTGDVLISNGASSDIHYSARVTASFGSVCGSAVGIANPTLNMKAVTADGGGVEVGSVGLSPNAIIFGKGNASGYLYITSNGQLAYYRTTPTPNGVVLTSL